MSRTIRKVAVKAARILKPRKVARYTSDDYLAALSRPQATCRTPAEVIAMYEGRD